MLRSMSFRDGWMHRLAFPGVSRFPVVRDPKNECALGALATKVRQGLPDRERNVLHQFLPPTRNRFIAAGQTRDGRTVLGSNPIKSLLQRVTTLVHGICPTRVLKYLRWQRSMFHLLHSGRMPQHEVRRTTVRQFVPLLR